MLVIWGRGVLYILMIKSQRGSYPVPLICDSHRVSAVVSGWDLFPSDYPPDSQKIMTRALDLISCTKMFPNFREKENRDM